MGKYNAGDEYDLEDFVELNGVEPFEAYEMLNKK